MIQLTDIVLGAREAKAGVSGNGAFEDLLSTTEIAESDLVRWCGEESVSIAHAALLELRRLGLRDLNEAQVTAIHSSLAVALETGIVSTIHAYESQRES